jgi:CHAD domain-containing protein
MGYYIYVETFLLDSLNMRWNKYQAELETCRCEFSEAAVHDFRVATRRLLSSLDLLRAVIPDLRIQKMRHILKGQLDNLDALRDVQVLLADISEAIHEIPELQSFQAYLQRREKKLLRAAQKEIRSLKIESLSRRIEKLSQIIEPFKETDLGASLFSAVDEAYAIVTQRYALIDPAQPATIHHLRIAFKKFRYMIEAIYPILQNPAPDYLKKLQDYQAAMGEIQDMEVALRELADFEEHAPTSYDPESVRAYYKERHIIALSSYIEDKGAIITFWRKAPDQLFPEEK